mmetsp:Transcript_22852/g.40407  ORF Transcript_22852/g.40407 Transcript_22852/m.40407 type:complete len:113 (+) Transcript_22852:1208-1546(+)
MGFSTESRLPFCTKGFWGNATRHDPGKTELGLSDTTIDVLRKTLRPGAETVIAAALLKRQGMNVESQVVERVEGKGRREEEGRGWRRYISVLDVSFPYFSISPCFFYCQFFK